MSRAIAEQVAPRKIRARAPSFPLPLPPRHHHNLNANYAGLYSSTSSSRSKPRNGYEPSDTETEWQPEASSCEGAPSKANTLFSAVPRPRTPPPGPPAGTISILNSRNDPPNARRRPSPNVSRRHSRSPYKPCRQDSIDGNYKDGGDQRKNISPYRLGHEEKLPNRTPPRCRDTDSCGVSTRSSYSNRSLSAPKLRENWRENRILASQLGVASDETLEINELLANTKLSKSASANADMSILTTDSGSHADIFFSGYASKKKPMPANGAFKGGLGSNNMQTSQSISTQKKRSSMAKMHHNHPVSYRKSGLGGRMGSSGDSGSSIGTFGGSFRAFTANRRQKNQTDTWLSCVNGGSCSRSRSPQSRMISESLFIERAIIVEELPQFWVDKHSPLSLSEFSCHKQQIQDLKQLISSHNRPHILFKGPAGSGKRSLSMAFLHDIFGDSVSKVTHDLKRYLIQEGTPMEVTVPLAKSPHHMEVNLKYESKNTKYALMGIVKEICDSHVLPSEVSYASFKTDQKVLLLHNVDKVAENIQHLIKWAMECSSDIFELILCCEDDTRVLESVKSSCKLISLDPSATHEIMKVLTVIAEKEKFELPMGFAAKIATKSKQNIRHAIMALEACKAHNYPFLDEQPIPVGWEEVILEVSIEILADPSPNRIFLFREKLQKLLVEFVPPKLILQKLVEQFLKGVRKSLKRELYYWHAYYVKRLPSGTTALLKLEEFLVKFMSIHRKSIADK